MRSSDSLLGLPFNILSYGILAHILAKTCDLELKELIYMGGDVHIYNNHLEAVRTQIGREPYPFPQIKINKELSSIEDIEKLQFSDFEIINYQCHPAIKAEMAV